MKKKQKRDWCPYSNIILPENYKPKHYRCQCGKRLKVLIVTPDDSPDFILWKAIKPHKTKVRYSEST